MQGVINVLKPPGMTSFDVISFLRKVTGVKKVGHMGTLDPEAVGVLPICIGNATKAIEFLMEKDKTYIAEATFGFETDTEDWTGNKIIDKPIKHTKDDVIEVVKSFIGKYTQTPPMYSAIKVNGERLYKLARKGEEVERPSREVEIYSIDILNVSLEKVLYEVSCSKGTYIRTLCKDIGGKLGCGGHLSFLARTWAGKFNIDDAFTVEEISDRAKIGKLEEILTNVEDLFDHLQSLNFNENKLKGILNGLYINVDSDKFNNGESIKIYSNENEFIGIGEIHMKGSTALVKRKKIFNEKF